MARCPCPCPAHPTVYPWQLPNGRANRLGLLPGPAGPAGPAPGADLLDLLPGLDGASAGGGKPQNPAVTDNELAYLPHLALLGDQSSVGQVGGVELKQMPIVHDCTGISAVSWNVRRFLVFVFVLVKGYGGAWDSVYGRVR